MSSGVNLLTDMTFIFCHIWAYDTSKGVQRTEEHAQTEAGVDTVTCLLTLPLPI